MARLLWAIQILYPQSLSLIRIAYSKSKSLAARIRLPQGCPVPQLFCLKVLWTVDEVGVSVHRIASRLFADDVVL